MDTSTLLGDGRWLGVGLQTDQPDGGDPGLYSRPDSGLLSNLFKPRSQGGLGVYRPAFFEAWPLPRIQCAPSGQNGDYWGCHWGRSPAPEAHPAPLTSAVVRLGRFQKTGTARTVAVVVTNNGTMPTKVAEISRITLRTLAGSGQATLVGPQLPYESVLSCLAIPPLSGCSSTFRLR